MHTQTARDRHGLAVMVGLLLVLVQPVVLIVVRSVLGSHRFDGISLISCLLVAAGAALLCRHTQQPEA